MSPHEAKERMNACQACDNLVLFSALARQLERVDVFGEDEAQP
jgi:hypothetical protein